MIPPEMIGTLHSHAYRALGQPVIAESKSKEWNEEYPWMAIGGNANLDNTGDADGNDLLSKLSTYRMSMIDPCEWEGKVVTFNEYWEDWKHQNGYMDFTDLIEHAINDVEKAPGDPFIILGDEAQDWSRLEFKLICEKWGRHADKVILGGDFDQSIFQWRGADAEYFINHPLPKDHIHVLSQSYRVPKAIHRYSQEWIRKIDRRIDAEYNPMDKEGAVSKLPVGYNDSRKIVDDIQRKLTDGKTCMVLTTCSYMLNPIIKRLREEGIPYHNPYRKQHAGWNPFGRKTKAKMPIDRIASFISPKTRESNGVIPWSRDEIATWITCLKANDVLARGVASRFSKPMFPYSQSELGEFLKLFKNYEDGHKALFMDLDWFYSALKDDMKKKLEYIIHCIKTNGEEVAFKTPRVTVGTIHSVKGGESDCVYVFPDISYQAQQNMGYAGSGKDAMIRVFYVAFTRAKEELILCRESSNNFMRIWE